MESQSLSWIFGEADSDMELVVQMVHCLCVVEDGALTKYKPEQRLPVRDAPC